MPLPLCPRPATSLGQGVAAAVVIGTAVSVSIALHDDQQVQVPGARGMATTHGTQLKGRFSMAEFTAATVKDLRERTGAGMMDCKKALTENNGDTEAAVDWLRTKGLAAAAKKSSRVAAEGLVGVATNGTRGALVEVNSETDFVAKNEQFQDFVRNVTDVALDKGNADIAALKAAAMPAGGTVEEVLTNNIATIGENQNLRRAAIVEVRQGMVVPYVHNVAVAGMGKIEHRRHGNLALHPAQPLRHRGRVERGTERRQIVHPPRPQDQPRGGGGNRQVARLNHAATAPHQPHGNSRHRVRPRA